MMMDFSSSEIGAQAAADAAAALGEDVGAGDLSAGLVADAGALVGRLVCRERAVLCGRAWFEACFLQMDAAARFAWRCDDGDEMTAAAEVCAVWARADALLAAERAAINFLQTLSGTASAARRLQKLAGDVWVVDTRKTIPKMRVAQKYAVRVGGARNHRMGLFDEILIKENHIAAAGGIAAALAQARGLCAAHKIQIEVQSLAEVRAALAAGARRILLDNFLPHDIVAAVWLGAEFADVEWEASGNIGEENIGDFAATGVHRISCGGLTKNVRAVDFSFVVERGGLIDEGDFAGS